jgi:hypothetical protein
MCTVHAWNSGSMFVSLFCSLAWLLRCVPFFLSLRHLPGALRVHLLKLACDNNGDVYSLSMLYSHVIYDVTNGREFRRKPFKPLSPSMVPFLDAPPSLTVHNVAYSSVRWLYQKTSSLARLDSYGIGSRLSPSFSSFPCRLSTTQQFQEAFSTSLDQKCMFLV